jgi:protein-tyrosine phosphatase
MPARRDAAGFATVIDLCAEMPLRHDHGGWRSFPLLDLVAPDPRVLRAAAAAIEEAQAHGTVLVCCALGYSRSAAALAAWLLDSGQAQSVSDAIGRIRLVRPRIVLDAAARNAIERAVGREP